MISSRQYPLFALTVVLTDILTIIGSFALAYWLRFWSGFFSVDMGLHSFDHYFESMIIVVPVYLLIFRAYRLYESRRHFRRVHELLVMVKALSIGSVVIMAFTFVYRDFSYSRIVLMIAWLLSILLCCAGRYLTIQLEYNLRRQKNRYRVVMIGINEHTSKLIKWSNENPHYGQHIIGVIDTSGGYKHKHFDTIPVLGTLRDLQTIMSQSQMDEVIITDSQLPREVVADILLNCESKMIKFKLAADFYGLITHYVDIEYISNVPLLGLQDPPLDDYWNRITKRGFDFICSFTILIITFPLFLLISALIKLTSPGPIFYKQERIGRDGKHFHLFKFRTMHTDAEKTTGPVWAQKNDQRTTVVGQLLRKTNLDELPQLWNVLIGHMSLVGPRPERPHFVEQFRDQIPQYMARHKIKSGLTGWAQINGLRGNTSIEERIKYDLYYMENWTLMMDIEILLVTPFAFKNAY